MPSHKIIYDTDPGVDDAMALFFLHYSPDIELVGITTGHGNAPVETTTRNALYLAERFGIDAPIARGAAGPLSGEEAHHAAFVHGENGLGGIDLPETVALQPIDQPAHRFIIETVRRHPGEITLLAVGRMTNLALALREDPGIAGLVKAVVIMGGAFGHNGHGGNVTPAAEANIHGDPLAADEIFAADWPITAIGLDVTHEVLMTTDYLRDLAAEAGDVGRFIWDISRFYEAFYRRKGLDGISVHDSSAAIYLVAPHLFETRRGAIRVVRDGLAFGQTIQKPDRFGFPPGAWDGRPSHAVCTGVDGPALLDLYRRTLRRAAA
ncbi:nucleoside hydrolase [Labrys monachus]|uniref:Inosine-uridine nucleoside N-ribohydrolase n=1 Tax=Labrys monachus TaxID=217067 RepID=A0ABU0F9D6_9HYPH|nr:nucleoside hydrolase [Labrys monachus]MDQ0391228.1 inosine-uridine nucleoside N-ribohydrolase [Labrys monachus]